MGAGRRGKVRTRALAAVAVTVVVLGCAAGCGGGGPGAGGGGRNVEGKDEPGLLKVLGAAQLGHVELGTGEVPGLVIEKGSAVTAGHGRPGTDRRACRPLVVAMGSLPQPAPVASVVNTFAGPTGARDFQGLLGTIRVSSYEGDDARTTLRELRAAAAECEDGFGMTTGEGEPQRFEAVRVLPPPELGDEAMAYRLVNAAEEAPSLVTVVRTGTTLSMFFATNLADPGRVEIPERLVAAQVAKVERLARAERPPTEPPPHAGLAEGGEAGDSDGGEEE
ncbi:hypothetical protein [Streptomyces sp. NPDC053048]|uniref:hypothetical protein n=1 Tax=Streptomyces sp. NPDC053048 TaxID=3365694 RepID=UPI0037D7582F